MVILHWLCWVFHKALADLQKMINYESLPERTRALGKTDMLWTIRRRVIIEGNLHWILRHFALDWLKKTFLVGNAFVDGSWNKCSKKCNWRRAGVVSSKRKFHVQSLQRVKEYVLLVNLQALLCDGSRFRLEGDKAWKVITVQVIYETSDTVWRNLNSMP